MSSVNVVDSFSYLSKKLGVQLIKAGSYQKKALNDLLSLPSLRSQIIDVPVTANENPLQIGFFSFFVKQRLF
jgi:hypothetical protein